MLDTFYFLRHAETEANRQGLLCGAAWDIELNAAGIAQAERAAEILHSHVGSVRTICSSPLQRARRTAEIVASKLDVAVVVVPELREWDVGAWDRRPYAELKDDFLGSAEPEGGEARLALRQRVRVAIGKCVSQEPPRLIVSHGVVWMTLQAELGIPPTKAENGVPLRVATVDGRWRVEAL